MPTSENYDDGYAEKREREAKMCNEKECGGGCKPDCEPQETEDKAACTCKPNDPCYFHGEHGTVSTTVPPAYVIDEETGFYRPNSRAIIEGAPTDIRFSPGDDGAVKFRDPARVCALAGLPSPAVPTKERWAYDVYGSVALTGHEDLDQFLEEVFQTFASKGHDYTGGDPDILHAFKKMGQDLGLPMEKAWGVLADKHWMAVQTFIKKGGQSESEPIEGRIKDLVVYLLLFYRMTRQMKANARLKMPEGQVKVKVSNWAGDEIGRVTVDVRRAMELAGLEKSPGSPVEPTSIPPSLAVQPRFDPCLDQPAPPPIESTSPIADPDAARIAQAVRDSEEESVVDIKKRLVDAEMEAYQPDDRELIDPF